MSIVFFDTETTGLPDFSAPSESPHQPHILSIAAVRYDDQGNEVGVIHTYCKPDDTWQMDAETQEIHGISFDHAKMFGVDELLATQMVLGMAMSANGAVGGHNASFDIRMVRIAMLRYGMAPSLCEWWKGLSPICTMRQTTSLCSLPPTAKMVAKGMNKPKPPSLAEAYLHVTGKELVGAHGALMDARASAEIYFTLKNRSRA